MNVPSFKLAAQYASLKDELLPAVEKVLAGGHYLLGANVAALEQDIAAYTPSLYEHLPRHLLQFHLRQLGHRAVDHD
jgi:hypothetical protein